MKLVHWVRKVFCFPCQVRTRKLVEALAESREALATRREAVMNLKGYVDEQQLQRANN